MEITELIQRECSIKRRSRTEPPGILPPKSYAEKKLFIKGIEINEQRRFS